MNAFKKNLHVWITAASLAAFLTGWGLFSHAPKPADVLNTTSGQTLSPTDSFLQALSNLFNGPSHPYQRRVYSRLRTGGS